jgi:hypothetical protein
VAPVPGHRRALATAWALSFLTTLASVVFAMAAIAGWVFGVWPATLLTLGVAAAIVVGGPLAAALHFSATRRRLGVPARRAAPRRVRTRTAAPLALGAPPARAALPPLPVTPEQAWGKELLDWRDRPWRRRRR